MNDRPDQPPAVEATPDLDAYVAAFGSDFGRATSGVQRAADPRTPATKNVARRSTRRRRVLLGVGTLTALAVTVVALPILPSPTPDRPLDVVSSARAALGSNGEIVHYRLRSGLSSFQGTKSTGCGSDAARSRSTEVWQATVDGPRFRVVTPGMDPSCGVMSNANGLELHGEMQVARDHTTETTYYPEMKRVEVTTGLSPTAPTGLLPALDPARSDDEPDLITGLKRRLDDGRLREIGRTAEGGRAVVRLAGHTTWSQGQGKSVTRTETDLLYTVDAATFAPVRFERNQTTYFRKGNGRTRDGSFTSTDTTVFLDYERLPATPENRGLLKVRVPSGVETITQTVADLELQNKVTVAREKRESAEGHRRAKRMNAEREAREAAKKP
jgi:hypothetical protein